jgi:hypothetical protein
MSDSVPSPTSISQDATQFAERLFKDALGAMNVFAVHIGSQLGLYRALADSPGLTPPRWQNAPEPRNATFASGSNSRQPPAFSR